MIHCPQPGAFSESVVWIMGLLVGRVVTYFGSHYVDLCFLLPVPVLLQCSQTATKQAISTLVKPLADLSEPLWRGWGGGVVA